MPVRGTLYIVEEYRKYIEQNGLNLYGSRLITLPIPQFYVFYNGLKEEPDYIELKLSDAFSRVHSELEPCMEFKAIMMNINRGHNEGLMKQCSTLREYAEFVARIRERTKDGTALGTAVEDVMDSCIRDGVLAEFLSIHRAEGISEKAHEVAVNLFAKGISAEEAASICGEDSSLVAEWHREWEAAK